MGRGQHCFCDLLARDALMTTIREALGTAWFVLRLIARWPRLEWKRFWDRYEW